MNEAKQIGCDMLRKWARRDPLPLVILTNPVSKYTIITLLILTNLAENTNKKKTE